MALRLALEESRGEVSAYYLKVWLEEELDDLSSCAWKEDVRYARETCELLGVPLRVVSLQREYYRRIVTYTLSELEAGRTPSPDVLCNPRIKLGAFLERHGQEAHEVATGHYARRLEDGGQALLGRAADSVKDQTYFLCLLGQEQLKRCRFPLGPYQKSEVREMAAAWGLPARDRADSQGICFLGRIKFSEFVRRSLGEEEGKIRHRDTGQILGSHRGHWFFTPGQRQGLGLSGGPWFVVAKCPKTNVVEVVHGEDLSPMAPRSFLLASPHWIAEPPGEGQLEAKIRHGPRTVSCELTDRGQGLLEVELEEPDPGIAPGQFAVFYRGPVCLGGGAIVSLISGLGAVEPP